MFVWSWVISDLSLYFTDECSVSQSVSQSVAGDTSQPARAKFSAALPGSVTSDCSACCQWDQLYQLSYCIIVTTQLPRPLSSAPPTIDFLLCSQSWTVFVSVFSRKFSVNPGRGCSIIGSWMYLSPRQELLLMTILAIFLCCKLLSPQTWLISTSRPKESFPSLFTKYWD